MAKYTYETFHNICYVSGRMLTNFQRHKMYLLTDRWEELREARLALDKHRCKMCNEPAQCVHHPFYPEVLGEETVDDLISLCNQCHKNFHYPPTLKDYREQLMAEKDKKAVKCACCDQTVKRYKRKFNHGMALVLIALHKWHKANPTRDWVHISDELCKTGFNTVNKEYSKLVHWKLIEAKPKSNKKGVKSAGYYRITDLGNKFAQNEVKVKEFILLFNKDFLGHRGNDIGIKDALQNYFDYDELMRS